jgi:hypothetical protein
VTHRTVRVGLPLTLLPFSSSQSCLQLPRHLLRAFDVSLLGRLVAANQKHVNECATSREVHAVTWPEVNPHLAHPIADKLAVSEVA